MKDDFGRIEEVVFGAIPKSVGARWIGLAILLFLRTEAV